MDDTLVRNVVAEVMQRLKSAQTTPAPPAPSAAPAPSAVPMATPRAVSSGPRFGLYDDVDAAAQAAHEAHMQLRKHGIEGRAKVIEIVKTMAVAKAVEWGKLEFAETKIGRLEHKVEKLQIIPGVPGTEWIQPRGMSGDNGITMEEFTPIGVVGAITPVTHSVPTLSGNIINIVAAGNGIVFNAHPGGAKCAATAVKAYNEAIHAELGISELITIIESPTIESFNQITQQPLIGLLCVTGGPGVVRAALRSGKRAICG